MARYQVRRIFPAHHPVKHGQIFEDPQWRNLDLLVSQGYLVKLDSNVVTETPAEIDNPVGPEPLVVDAIPAQRAPSNKPKRRK